MLIGVDITQIRWTGVLQRIAIAYFVTAISEIWLKNDCKVDSGLSLLKRYQYQWAMAFVLIAIYLSLLYGLYVPDWEYQIPAEMVSSDTKILSHSLPFKVKCGVRGDTGPACNAAGMVDRTVLGIQHLYRRPIYARTKECSVNSPDYVPLPIDAPSWCQAPFDPEGLLRAEMEAKLQAERVEMEDKLQAQMQTQVQAQIASLMDELRRNGIISTSMAQPQNSQAEHSVNSNDENLGED
nr:heparan-alpha-glucosaminide N-acetyltransferase-like [Ipomoea batatas]